VLSNLLPEPPSRSEVKRWIDEGAVWVDEVVASAAHTIRAGNIIRVRVVGPAMSAATPEHNIAFDVMHADDDVVVVMKPAGLVVHPAPGHPSGTLVNGLLGRGLLRRSELSEAAVDNPLWAGKDPLALVRPGIVHRLDRGTSGVMVVAKHARAREQLRVQFAAHSISREYVAIVVGVAQSETIATLHGRDPLDRKKFSTKVSSGKRAVTHVRALEQFGISATLVCCTLETGRTHQIRMHLADRKTPVLGDSVYGNKPRELWLRNLGATLGHQALHARLLAFEHPTTGARVCFEAEPPPDFAAVLTELRLQAGATVLAGSAAKTKR
jgi:23S rRNA pseudouridine1911/1915/1917 synthase